MRTVTFTEFRKESSRLLSEVENGEVLIVLRHGKPVAEISPIPAEKQGEPAWRRPGLRLCAPGASLSKLILRQRERD